MQPQHIRLKEIIWEITGECHNGCTYCGSKEICKIKTNSATIFKIAEAIAQYPPLEINISGGDPLLVPIETHRQIVHLFRQKGVVCKLIINPNSLISHGGIINQEAFGIIHLYDWVGVSINSKKELEKFESFITTDNSQYSFKHYTVITNFNLQNLYEFDVIEEFVKKQSKMWTIQFTVYEEPNNLWALYHPDSDVAFNFLKTKYEKSSAIIILSDNIREDIPCSAGIGSIGITHDGVVIPCLSMRSWTNPTKEKGLLNITTTPLEKIWMNGFKAQRFGCFKCCKDACNNKTIKQKSIDAVTEISKILLEEIEKTVDTSTEPPMDLENWKKWLDEMKNRTPIAPTVTPQPFPGNQVVMYGVQSPGAPLTLLYGVPNGNVYAYGVQNGTGFNVSSYSSDPEK